MQKFTRAITREVELGGERLALTFDTEGVTVRPVGSRKPPHTCSWGSLLCHIARAGEGAGEPSPEELAAAVGRLRAGKAGTRPSAKEPAAEGPEEAEPSSEAAAPVASPPAPPVLARLDRWLAEHRPRFHRNLRPGAGAAELDALAKAVGRPLPTDLRALLAWHNGQGDDFAGAFVQSWLLMSTEQIVAAKSELDEATEGWQREWVPFLDDDAGNYVCVDAGGAGGPVREYWAGNSDHPVVAPSLRQWLEEFVAAAERGDYVEDPERGRFLRRP